MINVSENFKIDIRTYGRQFNIKLRVNNSDFDADNLNYIKPSFTTPLFKTIMHQIELNSKVYMQKDTKINGRIGVKVNEKNYKYIDLNNYYVQSCERQEDTNSYRVLAYSKMKEAMIDYDLSFTGKLTVRNYLIKICERLGWNTDNIPTTFINSEKMVDPNLHTEIKYSFRDALDEIATITCSFLMFKGDNFYLLYLTETNEVIDESYLDEDNVTIGDKYFINSLVFSRAEESDNIYRKDNTSITTNGLHEYRIADCQLLSTNDRSDYIDEMFNYLKTLEFYIFEIQSKGILFLEACDLFNLKLNNVTYKVALLNDEINIEDGLTENLFLDKPEETETEYKYADSTDKRINQAYILVDKQNKKITQLTEETTENSEKITKTEQDVNGLTTKVSSLEKTTVNKVQVQYALGDTLTTPPTAGWSETAPEWQAGKYMWQKTVTTYSDGATKESKATCIQGAKGEAGASGTDGKDGTNGKDGKDGVDGKDGEKGDTGATGKGIKSIQDQYYLSDSNTTQTGGTWKNTQDPWVSGKYIWTRSHITWSDNTTTDTTPVLASALNTANETAKDTANNLNNNYYTKTQTDSQITQKADEITQRINLLANLTQATTGTKTIVLSNCAKGNLLKLQIKGNNEVFKYLYPSDTLYPSNSLYPYGDSRILVNEVQYELGITDVLRKNSNTYDEYILEEGQAKIIRRINVDGTIRTTPIVEELGKFSILLNEGTNTIKILNYTAEITAKYAIKNDYTDIFATKVEMNSSIEQTAEGINQVVRKKVDENEIISKINQTAETVGIDSNKINLSANDVLNLLAGNSINLTSKNITISSELLTIDKKGNFIFKVLGTKVFQVQNSNDSSKRVYITDQAVVIDHSSGIDRISMAVTGSGEGMLTCSGNGETYVKASGITTPTLTQTSKEESKKNFEKFTLEEAKAILNNTDIYKYNLKTQDDKDKKHIGFVIGDDYNYSEEITSEKNDGANIYSMTSVLYTVVQEQQKQIEELQQEIKELKGEK